VGRWRLDELVDVDVVAIDRAVVGDVPQLTMGERFLATVELRRRGLTYRAIACQLRIDDHQVYRYLARAGMTNQRREQVA
jgi:hypothetical protein